MIYEQLTGANDVGPTSAQETTVHPQISPSTIQVKQEQKPVVKPEPVPVATAVETDAELAARLQREFDSENTRGRASRSGGAVKKKVVKKRKSKATVGTDDEGETPKKRRGGGGGAFNKEMLLR